VLSKPHFHLAPLPLMSLGISLLHMQQENAISPKDAILSGYFSSSPRSRTRPLILLPPLYRANTFTTPSPPALTTHRPSWLHTTEHTPSPLIRRWLVISCVQLLVSRLQNRRLASWPAETSSRPSGESDSEEIAAGCASILYVH
jgi:hypothetical protein